LDVQTIDKEYDQLKQETDKAGQEIQTLAQKLQTAVDGGDAQAREWLLDLKEVALQVQQEQLQMQTLLQALHDFVVNNASQVQQAQPTQQQYVQSPQRGGGGIGLLGNFMGGGFGQAMKTGVGFGIGDALIGSIFRGL
jgi:hypothetical protein